MTVMTGHDYRRSRFPKRTFRNQYLGPFLNHEMNRCIQCYRCVRFYRDYAGGHDLNSFALRNHVFFGRHEDGVLENEFAGNLAEVCPTGVFTDATAKRHYTRKWDLQFAPSICVHCALGCNTSPAERYGTLRRIVNRYNSDVNGYFLCDRGRYGYEFVNSEARIRQPLWKSEKVTREAAIRHLGGLIANPERVIGIGSPRASLEANFALRTLVGAERFFTGLPDHSLHRIMLEILREGPARSPSLHQIELSDAVFILGEDVTNVAPRMALSLRQSVRQQPLQTAQKLKIPAWNDSPVREALQDAKGPLFIATPTATRLDDVASATFRAAPEDIARLGFAVAHALDEAAPAVPGLAPETLALAGRIAAALREAKQACVISGPSLNSEAIIQAAANMARALCRGGGPACLSFTEPESNSAGFALMAPLPLSSALRAVESGEAETVIILENDLYRRAPAEEVDAFLGAAKHVVVLDHLANRSTSKAELLLPAATFAEGDGTLVSSEGRAQRFFQVFAPQGDIRESWRWLRDAMLAAGRQEVRAWQTLDDVVEAIACAMPALAGIRDAAPPSSFRLAGEKIPREPQRYSGRTAMSANITVHEPKPPDDPDSPLSFSMEGYPEQAPPPLIPFFWSPGWNSYQAVNKFQEEIAGPLRGGAPGVRLIEPADGAGGRYFDAVPDAFVRRPDEWLIVPLYHIFGSEELSFAAPAVLSLAPAPYLALNPEDGTRLGVEDGTLAGVRLGNTTYRLPVRIKPELPSGIAGLPAGVPPFDGAGLPRWGTIGRSA
jgi:NADH-quinone oxidoreductase subunit G